MATSASATANRQIARAAGTVMLAYALSQVLGLVRWFLMTRYFGAGSDADAFNAARGFADILFNLVAGGALASAFIPTLTEFLTKEDRPGAWRLVSAVANLVTLILIGLALLSALFAPLIVRYLLARGFSPAQQALTVSLLRLMLPSAIIFGLSGLLMGVLNAHHNFLFPALASSMYWLGMILGILILRPSLGIYGPAWGAVFGAGLHLAIQLPGLLHLPGRKYIPTLGIHLPEVTNVVRLMGPRLFGVAVVQLNVLVNTNLASAITGGVTIIPLAFAIMTVPLFVMAQGIATASFPVFSAQAAAGKFDEMRSSLASTLRGMIFLALPASVGLILLREPLVGFLFERGQFTHASTLLAAWVLLWYAAGLVGHSVIEVVYRAFYALQNTKTPVLVGAAAMGLNLAFSFLFKAIFLGVGWEPLGGLALANSVATALEMCAALFLMRRRLKGLGGTNLAIGLAQAAGGSLAMTGGLTLWLGVSSSLSYGAIACGGVLVGAAIYVLAMLVLRVPETDQLYQALRRRLPWLPPIHLAPTQSRLERARRRRADHVRR
ncbi:MAG TPA: murein biosynthesis integral membrane protein MurJ [Anaerolineaceae bacterium]|jgi:putative peptidoglycan lipid II flippase